MLALQFGVGVAREEELFGNRHVLSATSDGFEPNDHIYSTAVEQASDTVAEACPQYIQRSCNVRPWH